jgi:hypothetical protein
MVIISKTTDRTISRKILIAVLTLALLFSYTFTPAGETDEAYAAKVTIMASTAWYVGHEADNSYTLSNREDILGLSDLVNAGTSDFSGKTINLANSLTDLQIAPIGTEAHPFNGTFDGGGHEFNGLQIATAAKQYIGLFGKTGAGSVIKNIHNITGTLTVSETGANGEQIRYVGAIAGYAGGDIENCSSGMNVSVTSSLTLGKKMGIIRNIGGLAGYIGGDIKDCAHSGNILISSPSDVNGDVGYLFGEIGGLAGAQGDVTDAQTAPLTSGCVNSGDFIFNVTGKGGTDRFGAQLYSAGFAAGGIIGQASGVITNCTNSGIINTSNDDAGAAKSLEATEGQRANAAEAPEAGRGASGTGGIVGSLRGNTFEKAVSTFGNASSNDPGYEYYKEHGGAAQAPAAGAYDGTSAVGSYPVTSGVYDCTNNGDVIGLAAVGGIVGSAGSFTEIVGCANVIVDEDGDISEDRGVKGCRWNKPFAGGIVGNTQGNIRYCYNRTSVHSVTGGGYYCSGIAGGLWSTNEAVTPKNELVPITEMTGCYVTGRIYTSAPGYRTAILAGENDGYIHDNVYLDGLSLDSNEVDSDEGTTVNNKSVSVDDLKGSKGIGFLNTYAAGIGLWSIFYLPDGISGEDANSGYPVVAHTFNTTGIDIDGLGKTPTMKTGAVYSVVLDPVPQITVDGLVQNADYRVVPQSNTKGCVPSDSTLYQAVVEGIGNYTGTISTAVDYTIIKANISDCTIVAAAGKFTWKPQEPSWVKLLDASGAEVSEDEYTWNTLYDKSKGTTGTMIGNGYHYYDYTNCHGDTYYYDIKAVAKAGSTCYSGETVQAAFRIGAKSLANMGDADKDTSPVKYGNVVWQGKEWNFAGALADVSGNYIKIPYTGNPITPKVKSISYLGVPLRLITGDWYMRPYDYDYRYVYGNPNPEEGSDTSTEPINVTLPGKPSCMTVRYTSKAASNFRNYINVFYSIIPADISGVTATKIAPLKYTGKPHTPQVKLSFNGNVLKSSDFTFSYSNNKLPGLAQIVIKGKGNYKGTKTLTFAISPTKSSITKVTAGKRKLTVKWKKPVASMKATSVKVRYCIKGTSKWKTMNVPVKKTSLVIKSLKKGKRYQVQTRIVRTIKSGYAKGTHYGAWSTAKISKAIK